MDYTRAAARRFVDDALTGLGTLPPSDARELFITLAESVIARDS